MLNEECIVKEMLRYANGNYKNIMNSYTKVYTF